MVTEASKPRVKLQENDRTSNELNLAERALSFTVWGWHGSVHGAALIWEDWHIQGELTAKTFKTIFRINVTGENQCWQVVQTKLGKPIWGSVHRDKKDN